MRVIRWEEQSQTPKQLNNSDILSLIGLKNLRKAALKAAKRFNPLGDWNKSELLLDAKLGNTLGKNLNPRIPLNSRAVPNEKTIFVRPLSSFLSYAFN